MSLYVWFCKLVQACFNSNEHYMWFHKLVQDCSNSNEHYMWFCNLVQACSNSKKGLTVSNKLKIAAS